MGGNWNILGHGWAVDLLCKQIADGATRQAYLFTGPPGIGRRTLALRFAQSLNCTAPPELGVPCGECWECKHIDEGTHPDVTVTQAATAGGILKVGQAREVRGSLNLRPYRARHRVAIFLRFQEANSEASNALLKILEEPPPFAVLMLTADDPESILPTIVSRCEVLRLRPLPFGTVQQLLMDRGAPESQAQLVSHLSGGCPGTALRMLEDETALPFRVQKLDELRALLGGSRAEKFAYANQISRDKATMRSILAVWLSFWRDVLWRSAGATSALSNPDRTEEIEALAARFGLPIARRQVDSLDGALQRLETNVNPRLLAEVLLLDLPQS
jgi:DNA polymerase-3 subunit delta'